MPEFVVERTLVIIRKEHAKVQARTEKAALRKAENDFYDGNYEHGNLVPLEWHMVSEHFVPIGDL